jgi:sodium-dependent dicarboxylate transporter 2/3/5
MATTDTLSRSAEAKVPSPAKPSWLRSNWGVLLAVAALVAVMWLPTPEGLSIAGQRIAVIVWMTEALDYAVSAVVIAELMAFLLGLSRNPANPKLLLGQRRPRSGVQGLCQYRAGAGGVGTLISPPP